MLKKLFLSLVLSLVVVGITPSSVQAQSNSEVPECTISLNGVSAVPLNRDLAIDQVPLTQPSRQELTNYYYDFNVTLSPAAQSRLNADCGPTARLSIVALGGKSIVEEWTFGAIRNLGGWVKTDLTGSNGSYTGSLSGGTNGIQKDEPNYLIPLWVEVSDSNNNSSCVDYYPICRQYMIRLNGNADPETNSCGPTIGDFSGVVVDQIPRQATSGQPITVSNPYSSDYAACGGTEIRLEVQYLANGSVQNFSMTSGTPSVTFTPQYSGQYRATFRFIGNQRGTTNLGGEEIAQPMVIAFCATQPGQTCTPPSDELGPVQSNPYYMCNQIPEQPGAAPGTSLREQCCLCATGSSICSEFGTEIKGVWTAVGCVKTDANSVITSIMRIGLSVAGGVTVLMTLAAGFMFSTSQGEPKRAGEAKDMITSAVVGLLFIIFSVTMLRFVGVDVLQIPGFGAN